MEKLDNFKAGEDGQNAYDKDRVRLTNEINRFRELDEADKSALEDPNVTAKYNIAIHDQREKALDAAHEDYTRAQTEATLVNEQYYTKPNEDPDIERAHQEKIKRLQEDLRAQMK